MGRVGGGGFRSMRSAYLLVVGYSEYRLLGRGSLGVCWIIVVILIWELDAGACCTSNLIAPSPAVRDNTCCLRNKWEGCDQTDAKTDGAQVPVTRAPHLMPAGHATIPLLFALAGSLVTLVLCEPVGSGRIRSRFHITNFGRSDEIFSNF